MNKVIKASLRTLNPRARRIAVLAVLAFAGVFTAACSDSSGPRTASTVTISPTTASIPVGGTQQFTAVVKNSKGNVLNVAGIWSVTGGGTITSTGLFTAGSAPGTSIISVSCSGVTATATVTVTAGPLASIVVTPNPGTMPVNTTLTYTASGRDALGNTVPITGTVTWSVVAGGGTVPAGATGLTVPFTAGSVANTFPSTVRATNGTLAGTATAIVTGGPPPPPPSGGFTILGRAAVTCSTGSIIGDVGTFQAPGDAPPGSITAACGPVTTGTVHPPGDPASKAAYNNFLTAYTARAPVAGDCNAGNTLAGTLAGVSLAPGTYCFTAAAALTGTLTLNGPPTATWLFKIGTAGTGDLSGTNFTVLMAGGAVPCNVTWWVQQATAMTTSNFKGIVLGGTGVTFTGGTFIGNGWAGASGTGDATETGTAITGCP